jgi:hypothetical protein
LRLRLEIGMKKWFSREPGNYWSSLTFGDGRPIWNIDNWWKRWEEILKACHTIMGSWSG